MTFILLSDPNGSNLTAVSGDSSQLLAAIRNDGTGTMISTPKPTGAATTTQQTGANGINALSATTTTGGSSTKGTSTSATGTTTTTTTTGGGRGQSTTGAKKGGSKGNL